MPLNTTFRLLSRWRWVLVIVGVISQVMAFMLSPLYFTASQGIAFVPKDGQSVEEQTIQQAIDDTLAYMNSEQYQQSICYYAGLHRISCDGIVVKVDRVKHTVTVELSHSDRFAITATVQQSVWHLQHYHEELDLQSDVKNQIAVYPILNDVARYENYSILRRNMLIGLLSSVSMASGLILIYENVKQRRQGKRKRKHT